MFSRGSLLPLEFNWRFSMKKILFLMLLAIQANSATVMKYSTSGYELNRESALNRKYSIGTLVTDSAQFGSRGVWKFSTQGGLAGTVYNLKDDNGADIVFPAGTVITNCLIDIPTALTSSSSSGKISIGVSDVGDLKAASFIATYNASSGPATKPLGCVPTGTTATMIRIGSEGRLSMQTGSEALTAGQIDVWVEYILSGTN